MVDVGVDGLDPVLDPVAQIGKYDGAAGDADVLDRKRIAVLPAAGFAGGVGVLEALAPQRHVDDRTDDDELGDLRPAGPYARQRHIRLDAAGGEAIVDVALFGVLQRDIVQRDVERRPQADLGSAVYGELVAGFALDPLLDLRRQEARGDADHQQQRDDDDHGSNGGPGNFQCSHIDIPDRASGIGFGRATGAAADHTSLSRKGDGAQRSQK